MKACSIGVVIAAASAWGGCGPSLAWKGDPPQTRLVIEDLGKDDDKAIVAAVKTIPAVSKVKVEKKKKDHIVLLIEHSGSACEIPARIEKAVTAPGLRPRIAETTFSYAAFDNKAPDIFWVFPRADGEPEVITEADVQVVVEVPDHDTEEVKINGHRAERILGGTVYRVSLILKEGPNKIVAVATDDDANSSRAETSIVLDTTPPALDARIVIIVEGKVEPGSTVLIDGREVSVSGDGVYRAEVRVRKGKAEVEIVAIDPSGNRTTTKKPILE